MRKKLTVSIIIVLVLIFMVVDFNVNGVRVFEDYVRQMETESMHKLREGRSFSFHNGTPDGEAASRDLARTIPVQDFASLYIGNMVGSVVANGEERDDIQLEYKITVYTDSAARSRELIDKIDIKEASEGERLVISLEQAGIADDIKAVKIDYRVRVPREMELYINNSYGPVIVRNSDGNVKLTNRYDQLRAENIGGKADINVRYGYLYLDGIADEAVVRTGYNNGEINNLKSGLDLRSDYARVELDGIAGPVDAECRYGLLQFEGLEGQLEIDARYTEISGKGPAGEMITNINYGGINLDDLKAALRVNSRYTDLNIDLAPELEDVEFDLLSDHGSIITSLPLEVEEDDFQDKVQGRIGAGTVRIELRTDYGDIKLLQ